MNSLTQIVTQGPCQTERASKHAAMVRGSPRGVLFRRKQEFGTLVMASSHEAQAIKHQVTAVRLSGVSRRQLLAMPPLIANVMIGSFEQAEASTCVEMPALQGKGYCKPATIYEDYVLTDSGLQYKDFRLGAGDVPQPGDKVVVDWDGYTVGYFGRIIQAKNLSKGGAFEDGDVGFLRFTLDSGAVIPAFEEALYGMRVGGIRRILVPPGPLNYPEDTGFKKIGPVPDTRSGKNALGFVVVNEGAIDKTLLFDIELLGIGPNAKARRAEGTWIAGPFAENK